jgi:Helix-loop-helix DNA-binding domain
VHVQQVFSEEFIQQSLLSQLLHMPLPDQPATFDARRQSSSSSSLPSLSVGSPEDSPLINIPLQNQSLPSGPTVSEPLIVPAPHQLLIQAYGRNRNLQFPAPASDEEAMARAIIAVISSSTTPSSSFSRVGDAASSKSTGAFKGYKSGLGPRVEPIKLGGLGSQRMVKGVLAMLRRIYWMRYQPRVEPEVATQPTGSQLHHMISERKRREKLNESFDALRKLLPPGSKVIC